MSDSFPPSWCPGPTPKRFQYAIKLAIIAGIATACDPKKMLSDAPPCRIAAHPPSGASCSLRRQPAKNAHKHCKTSVLWASKNLSFTPHEHHLNGLRQGKKSSNRPTPRLSQMTSWRSWARAANFNFADLQAAHRHTIAQRLDLTPTWDGHSPRRTIIAPWDRYFPASGRCPDGTGTLHRGQARPRWDRSIQAVQVPERWRRRARSRLRPDPKESGTVTCPTAPVQA